MQQRSALAAILLFTMPAGCHAQPPLTDVVWAVNVSGDDYEGSDGTKYRAEESVSGGEPGRLANVKGTQDARLYETYRRGDIRVQHSVADGTYDVTFHFAEPDEIYGGERLFDVCINNDCVIEDLDVMVWRDGQIRSALTVTVPDVQIEAGALQVRFEASALQPLLSALVIRNKVPRAADWKLVWSDEFSVAGQPDPRNWTIREWPPGVVNDEDQAYTARPKNIRVVDGHLVIEAHREDYGDARYTSGRMHSSAKRDFRYGRFEARARVPGGQGSWAAIWMLPSDPFRYATNCKGIADWQGNDDCDAWPNSGEIDILEHVGYIPGHVHGTVHNKAYYFVNWEQRKGRVLFDDATQNYHVYAVEWGPDRIDMFVDDTLYFTYVNEAAGWQEWPYDHPFHLILNLAIGGGWGRAGGPIDDSAFPQRLLVDFVRVYKLPD